MLQLSEDSIDKEKKYETIVIDSIQIRNFELIFHKFVPNYSPTMTVLILRGRDCLNIGQEDLFLTCELDHLEELEMSNFSNRLKVLPLRIGVLKQLRILDLHGNEIKSLPWSLRLCRNIEILRLNNNNLSELPFSIINLPKLNYLTRNGNFLDYMSCSYKHNNKIQVLLNTVNCLDKSEIPAISNLQELAAVTFISKYPSYYPNISSLRPLTWVIESCCQNLILCDWCDYAIVCANSKIHYTKIALPKFKGLIILFVTARCCSSFCSDKLHSYVTSEQFEQVINDPEFHANDYMPSEIRFTSLPDATRKRKKRKVPSCFRSMLQRCRLMKTTYVVNYL